jgi:anti-sigma regulatory factor (Ser/Thr protein kinase)
VTTVETTITNHRRDLARVTRLVAELASINRLAPDVVADVSIALDEVLTNIIAHGYEDDGVHEILVRLTLGGEALEAEILDDGKPFDPATIPPPALGGTVRERQVGGLGIHFVRNLMSEVVYSRAGGRNRLLLKRRLTREAEDDARGPA